MGRPVGADQSGAVHGEAHRQALDGDVVHHLIVSALQEGRIDRGEWLVAFGGKPGGERHAVLLGNADVESPVGKFLLEQVDAGARRHRRGDGDDLVVLLRFLDQAFAIDFLIGGRGRLRFDLGAGGDVEFDDAMVFVGGFFRRRIALALLRHDVNEDRPVLHVADILQDRQQVIDVVAVDRPDIEEAEFLEQRAAGDKAAGIFLHRHGALLEHFARHVLGDAADQLAQRDDSRGPTRGGRDRPTARRPAARSTCHCR